MTAICQIRHVSGWGALCKSIDWQCVLIASRNLARTRDGRVVDGDGFVAEGE